MVSVLDSPTYEVAEAARYLHMTPTRVSRWLFGYRYEWGEPRKKGRKPPVVQRPTDGTSRGVSFLDLMELLYARAFLGRGFSLQKVRLALEEAKRYLREDHPFARRRFFTWGRSIFLDIPSEGGAALVELLEGGQLAIRPIVLQVAEQIDFDKNTDLARAWWPLGKDRPIAVDPRVSFGAPSVAGRGVQTANIYDFYEAEDKDVLSVCRWFNLSQGEAEAAIDFEESLRLSA